jgi:hypothetical protein
LVEQFVVAAYGARFVDRRPAHDRQQTAQPLDQIRPVRVWSS